MVIFNEEKQNKKLEELRQREEENLAQILSVKYGVDYIDLSRVSINTDALRLVPESKAREVEVAPFNKVGKKLSVAVRSPNKQAAKDIVSELTDQGYVVSLYMVSLQSLTRAWDMYKDLSFAIETKAGQLDIKGDEIHKLLKRLTNLDDVKVLIEEILEMKKSDRISRILEIILAGAIFTNASDAHIEPEENHVRLRYRLDGVLVDVLEFDIETYKLILSRIKLISGLKLNIKKAAQDGRFSISIEEENTEVRTSILPDAYGESIVMRLLNLKMIKLPLEKLGIEKRLFDILLREIKKPNGMILITGPTGSGKTTTLYAILRIIHNPEIKIITIEDPIEYHLPGIVQTQVDKKNYTFSLGLRSALRQDPDVIMVGEIREAEVADTAIQSALTGHLVFSTLHTNNAAGSFPRLINFGINSKIIGSAVNISIAQRLIRRLCTDCKKEVTPKDSERETINRVLDSIVRKEHIPGKVDTIWQAEGCEQCNHSGYKGRIGIYEAIIVDEAIEKLITENPSEREITRAARQQGILMMRQDGILKMLDGITSFEELNRVVALDDDIEQAELDKRVEQLV